MPRPDNDNQPRLRKRVTRYALQALGALVALTMITQFVASALE